jgi:hypothetical protein
MDDEWGLSSDGAGMDVLTVGRLEEGHEEAEVRSK